MKKIKVFWYGKRLKDIYPHATPWQVFKWKVGNAFRAFMRGVVMIGLFLGLSAGIGAVFFSSATTTYATVQVPVEVQIDSPAPVLDRIADCESGKRVNGRAVKGSASHYKNGQVLAVGNKNGSVDYGIFQINLAIWAKKATELGYDLGKEEDNRAFAKWLYANLGTEPWVHSKPCWIQ